MLCMCARLLGMKCTRSNTAAAAAALPTARRSSPLSLQAQRQIREMMVRRVLLSPRPLTSHELVELVRREHTEAATVVGEEEGEKRGEEEEGGEGNMQTPVEYLREFLMSTAAGEHADNFLSHGGKSFPCPVESTVRLVLALDSQFRLSPAGYVCYPNLPSLIIASTNVEQKETWMQVGRQLMSTEEKKHSCTSSSNGGGGKSGAPTRWRYILSLWFMLDAVVETEDSLSEKAAAAMGETSSTLNSESISKQLMKHWTDAFDEGELPPLLLRELSTDVGEKTARKTSLSSSLELQECVEGSETLRRWLVEAKEGFLSQMLLDAPRLSRSDPTLLNQVNDKLGFLFSYIIGAPISLGRLSALIQWENLPYASHYRSLLHFLLLYVGNPTVAQLERHILRRRDVHKRWIDLLHLCLQGNNGCHWPPRQTGGGGGGGRRSLSGCYASREYIDDYDNDNDNNNNNNNKIKEEGDPNNSEKSDKTSSRGTHIPSELHIHWLKSGSGPTVNPRSLNICRCIFLKPTEMIPLDVTNETPSEVLEKFSETEGAANDVIIFDLSPYVFERRICRLIRVWWTLEGQYTVDGNIHNGGAPTITLRRLCQLCLWEHEYGGVMASKMMLHYLRSVVTAEATIQLMPPSPVPESDTTPMSTEDAGRWLVALRSTS